MCGLTPAGPAAIQEMMHLGMLIDVDHMSHASAEQAIALAQSFSGAGFPGYPLNSGHNSVREIENPPNGNERALTAEEYTKIGTLHGMSGIGTSATDACDWLSHYNATISAMSMDVTFPIQVIGGIATDWYLIDSIPPRTAGSATNTSSYNACVAQCVPSSTKVCPQACAGLVTCNGQPAPAFNVPYNTAFGFPTPWAPSGNEFAQSSLGDHLWDYNVWGAAHYGMLPDFLEDVSTLSGGYSFPNGSAVVSSMMYGAQYFYQTWRIAERVAATIPSP
jgi:hypothetical protein